MKKSPHNHTSAAAEQFDLNGIRLTGTIQRVWGRGKNVFARLRIAPPGDTGEVADSPPKATHATLVFESGMVGGHLVDLQESDRVRVDGVLIHYEYAETLRNFLDSARAADFLNSVPESDLLTWRGIAFKRVNTQVLVTAISFPDQKQGAVITGGQSPSALTLIPQTAANHAVLEGVVVRRWEYNITRVDAPPDLFVRLAVYDQHTRETGETGNYGRKRRKPHYITVLFPESKTSSGRTMVVSTRDRLRVTGALTDRGYRQTLRQALVAIGDSAVIEAVQRVQADRLDAISSQQEQAHIEAVSAVVYSNTGRSRPATPGA